MTLRQNQILDVDSYKSCHFKIYPPGTTAMYDYLESRGGQFGSTIFFGLQYWLKEYLSRRITQIDIDEAATFLAAHGEPFNAAGFQRIVDNGGYWPVKIKAVPEGTEVPTHNVLMSIESTDPDTFWAVSWLETQLVRLWYPTTVATLSFYCKKMILEALQTSANDPWGEIYFKLHDFGSRGVSSRESAGIGGMAHTVNFYGSDTIEGVRYANHYYNHPMAAFSIPAAEHSTHTMWGREREYQSHANMVKQFLTAPGKVAASVSDSFDYWDILENCWGGDLRDVVKATGGTLVIRPDSGEPPEVVLKSLQVLERKVGMEKNMRGYKVLPPYFRLIQGDGINIKSIPEIIDVVLRHNYSMSNLNLGMGGGLLQLVNRDTQRFALKCSEATINGQRVAISKDPITDPGKRSKAGRQALIRLDGSFATVRQEDTKIDELVDVWENGRFLKEYNLEEVRKNSERNIRR
ncbi:nicotinate phosphoribosyltransferase [Candidatus Pacearchaeota archaeon]|jgi:nicotinamide phosphoribosyltransferase|nr:nicotinate phosphoribosyltransferase [Candidatus Pacearchaeota archaeon]